MASMLMFTACNNPISWVGFNGSNSKSVEVDTEVDAEECAFVNKKLLTVDRFIAMVNKKSAFHLEELAGTMSTESITVSNNKPVMLRDAAKRRAELLEEKQQLGCKAL